MYHGRTPEFEVSQTSIMLWVFFLIPPHEGTQCNSKLKREYCSKREIQRKPGSGVENVIPKLKDRESLIFCLLLFHYFVPQPPDNPVAVIVPGAGKGGM